MRWFLLVLLLPQIAIAATVTGTVYDLGLEIVPDSVITIDTDPAQKFVAKDGMYTFTVPEGTYTIHATATVDSEPWVVDEPITVTQDGTYTVDLILEPDFFSDDDLLFEDDLPLEEEGPSTLYGVLVGISVLLILTIIFFFSRMISLRAPKNIVEDDEFRTEVLRIIKKHKGRITQRELRKEVTFSEAKVSLVLTELEDEGLIKKIKKGRGNVIVKI